MGHKHKVKLLEKHTKEISSDNDNRDTHRRRSICADVRHILVDSDLLRECPSSSWWTWDGPPMSDGKRSISPPSGPCWSACAMGGERPPTWPWP